MRKSNQTLKLSAAICTLLMLAASASAIPWMFQPTNEIHSLSNNYMELQDYGYFYYHDGIDVIKPAGGEPVYSVSDGYMTHESTGTMYGGLMIGDEYIAGDDGWLYWHLPSSTFQFNVGDRIMEGDYLGDIATWSVYEFHHCHFNKVVGTGGLPWGWYESTDNPLVYLEPNNDPQVPTIYNAVGSNLLAFCVDNTSNYLNPNNLSGSVDIITKIGDLINNADWEVAPYKIEYSINGADIYDRKLGFLFEGILPSENTITTVIYKDDATCPSSGNYTERDFFFSVTNHDDDAVVEIGDESGHWNTAGYPVGQYWVAIHASDVGGNAVSDSMQVTVQDAPVYNVTVDLTPIGSTQIPSSGGTVTYSVAVNNYETSTVNFDAWLDLTYPSGSIEIIALRNLTVPAGGSIFRELSLTIAGSEPDGSYFFAGNVGYQPYNPWQSDGFTIQKGTDGSTGPWVNETTTEGWDRLCDALENLPPEKCTLARVPYKVHLTGPKTLSELSALKLDVVRASVSDEPFVEVFLNTDELTLLQNLGYRVEDMPYQAREMFLKLKTEPDGGNPMREYHSYDEIASELQAIAAANPDICVLHNAGTSEQGRALWFMQISDNVGTQEDEPEFVYISTMHGDEPVGMEMCMYFINLLVDRYGIDPEINALVDDNELWIMPLMNPDGYVAGQRYNANGVDLNRDFPDRVDDAVNTTAGRAAETANVMNWSFVHQPILSANFHTGALVVNYVWDHSFDPQANAAYTDDQDLVLASAETYSSYNTPMWNNNSGSFNNGTVNGADWYQISGGMMDWNYHWMGDLDNTIELSNIAWPGAGELPQYWEENRQSMIEYINFNHRGVRGIVTDAVTGLPLLAEIDVVGRDFTTYTDPDVGDYHRMLVPGTYNLDVTSFGYWPEYLTNVVVTEGGAVRYDVQLQSADLMTFSGTLHHPAGSGLSARLYLLETPYDPVETDINGDFAFTNVYEGEYTLRINNLEDNSVIDIPVTLETGMIPLELWGPVAAFYDGFESGLGNWTAQGTWGISGNAYAGNQSAADSPGGEYGNNQNISLTKNSAISLADYDYVSLAYQITYNCESNYDSLFAEVSLNGSTWESANSHNSRQDWWSLEVLNLDDFAGSDLYLRYRLQTDGSVTRDGGFIDEVRVGVASATPFTQTVTVTLTPSGMPIEIPASGGNVDYNIEVDNSGGSSATFDVWCDVTLPAGTNYGPLLGPVNLTLGAGLFIDRDRTQVIPGGAPAGTYTYNGYAGQYPDVIWSQDSFDFEKLGSDGSGMAGWVNFGEDFNTVTEALQVLPEEYTLAQNYPNPFNPTTQIHFALPDAGNVSLKVFNTAGQLAATLVDGPRQAGWHEVTWDAGQLATGLYVYRLQAGDQEFVKKAILIK